MKAAFSVGIFFLLLSLALGKPTEQKQPLSDRPTVVDFSGIKIIGFLATFPRGLSEKEVIARLKKGDSKKQPLKGKLTVGADQQAMLVLWQPDELQEPINLSVLDQFQPDDLAILGLHTEQVSAKELKRLWRHTSLRMLGIGPLKRVSNEDLVPLAKMNWLEKVEITGPALGNSDLPVLRQLPGNNGGGLRSLNLEDAHITNEKLRSLSSYTGLQRLVLSNTNITDEDLVYLKGFTELRELILSSTKVNGSGLRHLSGLKHLHHLCLKDTRLTDEVLKDIKKLTSLQELDLRGTKITDEGLQHLAGLKQLRRLDISRTKNIHGSGLRYLVGLDQLETVLAQIDSLGDEGLKYLGKLKNLRRLYLEGAAITDEGLMYLSGMESLRELHIGGGKITREGIQRFKEKNPHVKVNEG